MNPGLYFSFCECKLKLLQHRRFWQIGGVGVKSADMVFGGIRLLFPQRRRDRREPALLGMDRWLSMISAAFFVFECKAIRDYSSVIKNNPGADDVLVSRGNAYAYSGRFQEAIDDFTAAIEINPDNCLAYWYRGAVWEQISGKEHNAQADYAAARRIASDMR